MAIYAKINENNVVVDTFVVDETMANRGLDFLNENFPGVWVETFADGSMRGKYASIKDTYDPELDVFKSRKPFDSWVYSIEIHDWQAPVDYPDDGQEYAWDESALSWIVV